MLRLFILLLLSGMLAMIHSDKKDLQLPALENGLASPGKRVAVVPAEYEGTGVHHLLYLPPDWDPDWRNKGRSWPVVVEYTGNRFPTSGSSGEIEGAALGYGLSGGKYIWVVLPFVADDHQHNEVTWWGDQHATVEYAKKNVPRICKEFGGDSSRVFLCGFSRGAIAVNYMGLFDDEVAKLWCGFITHDHYDGVREWKGTDWGSPLANYREAAVQRLNRLQGRPVLICQNGGTREVEEYLSDYKKLAEFTFLGVPVKEIFPQIPNTLMIHPHTDRWMFVDSEARRQAWNWMEKVSDKKFNVTKHETD
jgi:hypothetical protein